MSTRSDAELERFFKKDIIEYLDKQLVLRGAQTEIKKLDDLIAKNDFVGASKIIEDAVDDFNSTDNKDVYKEIKYNKIIELVRIAHSYTKELKQKNRLTEDIDLLESSGQLEQNFSENITVFDKRKEKEKQEKEKQEKLLREKAQQIENEMIEINKKLFVSLRKKDVKEAINNYKEYKKKFAEYPSIFSEEKKELYNDLIAFYMRIKKLKEEVYDTNINIQKIKPKRERHKVLKIEEIKKIVEEIKEDTEQKKYKDAKTKIIMLKHKISLIPEKYKNIKNKLEDIAKILVKRLEFHKKLN